MRVISAIDNRQVIRAILEHLGLWLIRSKPPPKAHARQFENTPLPISSFKHTLILSMAIPNTHGMNTSNHNAS